MRMKKESHIKAILMIKTYLFIILQNTSQLRKVKMKRNIKMQRVFPTINQIFNRTLLLSLKYQIDESKNSWKKPTAHNARMNASLIWNLKSKIFSIGMLVSNESMKKRLNRITKFLKGKRFSYKIQKYKYLWRKKLSQLKYKSKSKCSSKLQKSPKNNPESLMIWKSHLLGKGM